MNGYSKMKLVSTTKSRSIDFSDLLSFPQTPKPITNTSPNITSKAQETKEIKNSNTHDSFLDPEDDEEDGNGERFGVMLKRNSSVSSTSSHKFRFDKQTTAVQSAVKRAFSMRRSSSVSERYCRIHDQSMSLASPIDGDEGMVDTMQPRSMNKKKHRSGKIFKACKRLFGF